MAVLPGGKIVDAGDMSTTVTSETLDIQGTTAVGLHFVSAAAGTRAGTWAIQVSTDNSNWSALNLVDDTGSETATIPVTASTLQNDTVDLVGLGQRFLRVVFTNSSGTGTGSVWAIRKPQSKG